MLSNIFWDSIQNCRIFRQSHYPP